MFQINTSTRKLLASALAVIILAEISIPTFAAQGNNSSGVAEAGSEWVNPFTGDFSYGVPLLTVPGPNGESFPVSLNYQAGIRMDQQASWIGLGWDFNPGEIRRDVKGVPDDWKNENAVNVQYACSTCTSTTEDTYYYGPCYYKDFNWSASNTSMDIYASNRYYGEGGFYTGADYDQYYASGPLSGKLLLRLYDYGSLFAKSKNGVTYRKPSEDSRGKSWTKSPTFAFKGDGHVRVKALQDMGKPFATAAGFNAYLPKYTPSASGLVPFSGDYSSNTNRPNSGKYVEYYTNSEINNNYTTIKGNGFLDYHVPSGTRRPSADFPADGIGAIRVVDGNGMQYHYSLPVYTLSENVHSFSLNGSFALDNADTLDIWNKAADFAGTWKLTAITGYDYVDANNNGMADEGDTGYWISINYGKWTNSFAWRFPFYGYKYDLVQKWVPNNYHKVTKLYEPRGSVADGSSQDYYLNTIKTSTHTAFFVKEVRLDAHNTTASPNAIPSLRLSKVVLLRNEDASLFANSGTMPGHSGFSFSNCSPGNVVHIGNYNDQKVNIEKASLKTVELSADYSLCKKLYNNINNTFSLSNVNYTYSGGQEFLYAAPTYSTTADANNSGKLTLNEIISYERGYSRIFGSYVFDYDKNSSTKNPDYNHEKCDFWGYYKSDFNSSDKGQYTTPGTGGSFNHVDAWSLKKITTPLGAEITPEYESDDYKLVGGYTVSNNYTGPPHRSFLISSVTWNSTGYPVLGCTATMKENDFGTFFNASPSQFSLYSVLIPFKITQVPSGCGAPTGTLGRSTATTINQYNSGTNVITINSMSPTPADPCSGYTWNVSYINNNLSSLGYGYVDFVMNYVHGGGLRVKKINIKETQSSETYSLNYLYLDADGKTTGICSTEPSRFTVPTTSGLEMNYYGGERHILSPGVGYTTVTITKTDNAGQNHGKTILTYNNFEETYKPFTRIASIDADEGGCSSSIFENLSRYGTLRSSSIYDQNNQCLGYTVNEYSGYADRDDHGARIQEAYYALIYMSSIYFYTISMKEDYSTVLKKRTTYKDGVTSVYEVLERDIPSGMATKARVIDETNGVTQTEVSPAYTDYPELGAKSICTTNPCSTRHNLVNAVSRQKVYRDKIAHNFAGQIVPGNPELVSDVKTAFVKSKTYRKYNSSSGRFENYTATDLWLPEITQDYVMIPDNDYWRQLSQPNLFMQFNNTTLENKNILGNRYTAVKYGYNNQYPLCSAKDANYNSFTFSGFEDKYNANTSASPVYYYGGEVTRGDQQFASNGSINAHTGQYMCKVTQADPYGPGFFMKGFEKGRTYRASVWVHNSSTSNATLVAQLDGSTTDYQTIVKSSSQNVTVGNWTLMYVDITVPSNYTESGGPNGFNDLRFYLWNNGTSDAYFDDFCVRPIDVSLTGNVYDPVTGWVTAQIDNNGFAVLYSYDNAGRVIATYKEIPSGLKLISETQFNTAR